MHRNPDSVSTKSRRIAELARQPPRMGFDTWTTDTCVSSSAGVCVTIYLARE